MTSISALVMEAKSVLDVGCGTGAMLHRARQAGHAFQVLIGDDELRASLTAIRRALVNGGRFAFETRNPPSRTAPRCAWTVPACASSTPTRSPASWPTPASRSRRSTAAGPGNHSTPPAPRSSPSPGPSGGVEGAVPLQVLEALAESAQLREPAVGGGAEPEQHQTGGSDGDPAWESGRDGEQDVHAERQERDGPEDKRRLEPATSRHAGARAT